MFCPSCGAADQNPDAYCRRCGQWLVNVDSIQSKAIKKREDQMRTMVVFNALSAVLALTSAIVLYSTYLDTPEIKWSVYVAGALCSVIAVHQTISFFLALTLTARLRRRLTGSEMETGEDFEAPAAFLTSADTARIINQSGVTENTTRTLEAVPIVEDIPVSRPKQT